ncbi:hypothetical protein BGX27_003928, partial [Mortierella sp. AM989]
LKRLEFEQAKYEDRKRVQGVVIDKDEYTKYQDPQDDKHAQDDCSEYEVSSQNDRK